MDVAVIGGGVIGLAVAWRAARAGLSVAVVDPEPGSGSSHFAAGMIAPVGEAEFGEEAVIAINCNSAARYPSFIAELELDAGRSAGYLQNSTLHVAADADEQSALDRLCRHRQELGLPVTRLTSYETRALEPSLSPSIRGGMLVESDHQVDPRAMVAALLQACNRLGVEIHRSRGALLVEGGRAAGVRLNGDVRLASSKVVLAAGCWSQAIPGIPDEDALPVRPVKGQILRLRGDPGLVTRSIRGERVYLVPRGDGRFVIGGTVEEDGFDTTVTAGAVLRLLDDARALLPDVTELELVEASAGLRPGSPDNMPIVGEATTPGLIVATGHYRNGFLLAPATADAVAGVLAGGAWPAATRVWSPARFRSAPVMA